MTQTMMMKRVNNKWRNRFASLLLSLSLDQKNLETTNEFALQNMNRQFLINFAADSPVVVEDKEIARKKMEAI